MKSFFAPGENIEFVASGAVSSGDIIVAGSLVGIAAADYESGEVGVINLKGVYKLTKAGSQAWTLGQPVYKTAASQVVTNVSTSNVFLGYAAAAVGAGAGETIGYVLLDRPGVPA